MQIKLESYSSLLDLDESAEITATEKENGENYGRKIPNDTDYAVDST